MEPIEVDGFNQDPPEEFVQILERFGFTKVPTQDNIWEYNGLCISFETPGGDDQSEYKQSWLLMAEGYMGKPPKTPVVMTTKAFKAMIQGICHQINGLDEDQIPKAILTSRALKEKFDQGVAFARDHGH